MLYIWTVESKKFGTTYNTNTKHSHNKTFVNFVLNSYTKIIGSLILITISIYVVFIMFQYLYYKMKFNVFTTYNL